MEGAKRAPIRRQILEMLLQICGRPRKPESGDHPDAGARGDEAYAAVARQMVLGRISPAVERCQLRRVRPSLWARCLFALFRNPPLPCGIRHGLGLGRQRPRLRAQDRALAKSALSQDLDPGMIHACVDGVERPRMHVILVRHRLQAYTLGGGDQLIRQVPLVLVRHAVGAVVVPSTAVTNNSALGRHVSRKPELDRHVYKSLRLLIRWQSCLRAVQPPIRRLHWLPGPTRRGRRRLPIRLGLVLDRRLHATKKHVQTGIKHEPLRLEALALLKERGRVGHHVFPAVLAHPHPHRAHA